jgi:hypothetical protein
VEHYTQNRIKLVAQCRLAGKLLAVTARPGRQNQALTKIGTAPKRADGSRNKQQGRATPRTESRVGILAGNEIRRQIQDAGARDSRAGALHGPERGICVGFRGNGYSGSKPERNRRPDRQTPRRRKRIEAHCSKTRLGEKNGRRRNLLC